LVGSLLVLATFMTSCSAFCYRVYNGRGFHNLSTECESVDGTKYPVNSRWRTPKCEECYCKVSGISYCNIAPIPMGFDHTKCLLHFHHENCTYSVVEVQDSRKQCIVHNWIV
ncbi:Beta-microseminoprotein, partial [Heterocephalus glaber]